MRSRYVNCASSSSCAVTTRSAGVTHTRICMQNPVTHPKIHVFMPDLPGVELRCRQIRSLRHENHHVEIPQFCLARERAVIHHFLNI